MILKQLFPNFRTIRCVFTLLMVDFTQTPQIPGQHVHRDTRYYTKYYTKRDTYESVCSRYWYSRKGEKATKHSIALVASFLPPFPCLLCASACRPFSFRSSSPSSQPRIPLLSAFKLQPHLTYPSYILTPL